MDELGNFTLAALFYEVGRFKQRASQEKDHHRDILCDWLRQKGLNPVADGMLNTGWKAIIETAGKLASGDGLLDEEESFSYRPLVSVFSRVRLPGKKRPECPERYHRLEERKSRNMHSPQDPLFSYPSPEATVAPEDYRALWEKFEADIERLGPALSISQALWLLEKYTSFLPVCQAASEARFNDLSLFFHARTTAALAVCLYQYLQEENKGHAIVTSQKEIENLIGKPFLFVGGDLSGIQDFVYRIPSKGALKSLRGRSFFLELLSHHVVEEILHQCHQLSRVQVLRAGGGGFNLLLPNLETAREALENVRREVNDYLLRFHGARVYLVLEGMAFSVKDLLAPDGLRTVGRELGGAIGQAKGKKYWPEVGTAESTETRRKCSHCHQDYPENNLMNNSEIEQWDFGGSSPRPPLCQFCFLLLPKERKLNRQLREESFSGLELQKCPWCHTAGPALTRKVYGVEEHHGCVASQCLGQKPDDPRLFDECDVCFRKTYLAPFPQPGEEESLWGCAFCRNIYHLGEHGSVIKYILRVSPSSQEPEQFLLNTQEPQRFFLQIGKTFYYFPLARSGHPWGTELVPKDFSSQERNLFCNADSWLWVINSWDLNDYQLDGANPLYKAQMLHLSLSHYAVRREELEEQEDTTSDREKRGVDFALLAEHALGAERIGVLRMDVDNLGSIYTRGLQGEDLTFSRQAMLGEAIARFFTEYMDDFCRGCSLPASQTRVFDDPTAERKRKVVIVYSGGDDLFIVGAWHDVIELAYDIRRAFTAYTCDNPDLTLSGGIIVQDPHFPLYHMAKRSGEALDEAKKFGEGEKNAFAPFFESVIFTPEEKISRQQKAKQAALCWPRRKSSEEGKSSAEALFQFVQNCIGAFKAQQTGTSLRYTTIPGRFLHHLFTVVEMKEEKEKLYLPALVAALNRLDTRGNMDLAHIKHTLLKLSTLSYLHPAITWLELLSRGKSERGA